MPTISKVTTAIDDVEKDVETYSNAHDKVSSESKLDEDKLNQQIAIKETMKKAVDASLWVTKQSIKINPVAKILDDLLDVQSKLNTMSNDLEDDIQELKDKLEKLQTFSSETSSLFTNSLSDMKLAMQGVVVLNNTIVNSDGTYTFPDGTDKSWFDQLKNESTVQTLAQKKAYIKALQEQFGFDEVTANQIYKIKEGLDEKFPNLSQKERDYLFTRIIGEFCYSDTLEEKIMWANTAGSLSEYFYSEAWTNEGKIILPKELKEIILELGLSEKEYKELSYNIRLQHQLSPGDSVSAEKMFADDSKGDYLKYKSKYEQVYGKCSNEEFNEFFNQKRNDFGNKGDYAHQSITTATILDENVRLANGTGIYTGRFDSKSVDEIAGWKGDTTNQALTRPSIGNDDYKADLDAVNIAQRMKDSNSSYTQASNNYYSELSKGQTNRAEEFKKNSGYEYVKKEIIDDLAPKYEYTAGDIKYQTKYEERPDAYNANIKRLLTEQEKVDALEKNYPESYNFIESLKNNENEYTDYANKEN